MIEKLRLKLLNFINSNKDAPLLAGFSVGFYMIVFYYSKNYSLANSLQQLGFFVCYYIALPMLTLYTMHRVTNIPKLDKYKKPLLFTITAGFFTFYLLQLLSVPFSKAIVFGIIILGIGLLSLKAGRFYKFLIVLFLLLSVFNVKPLAGVAWKWINSSDNWKVQPDDIENVVFKKRPNIYYIQPDGYTGFKNLNDSIHNFNNSDFEGFLKTNHFTLYPEYRSNYYSTLLSNSATFSMKHHFIAKDVESYAARGIIIGDNPVLRILKKNNYTTHFITESPYLIIDRPEMGYDSCNIIYSELPYIGDGLSMEKNVEKDLENQILNNSQQSANFYFVEKFLPGHIATYTANSKGIDIEKKQYLKRLAEANIWLKKVIGLINKNDKDALIIIGADHGGFIGFKSTHESLAEGNTMLEVNSIFGAALAVKSNDEGFKEYENNLVSGVNLFRTLFSYLADDKKYLEHKQEDESYIMLLNSKEVYKNIDSKGRIVFEKQ